VERGGADVELWTDTGGTDDGISISIGDVV
jgi:hypothetical protein